MNKRPEMGAEMDETFAALSFDEPRTKAAFDFDFHSLQTPSLKRRPLSAGKRDDGRTQPLDSTKADSSVPSHIIDAVKSFNISRQDAGHDQGQHCLTDANKEDEQSLLKREGRRMSPSDIVRVANKMISKTPFGNLLSVHRFEVGHKSATIDIHTEMLARKCPGFLRRINLKAQTPDGPCLHSRMVDFNYVSIRTFRMFTVWLYHGRLANPPTLEFHASTDTVKPPEDEERLVPGMENPPNAMIKDIDLAKIYLFASVSCLSELQKESLLALFEQNIKLARTTSKEAIIYLSKHCAKDSRIHRTHVEEAVRRLQPSQTHAKLRGSPDEYVEAIFDQLIAEKQVALDGALPESEQPSDLFDGTKGLKYIGGTDPALHELLASTCTITVGEEAMRFVVHKGLVSRHSGYFRAAFRNKTAFVESTTHNVNLPEDTSQDVSLFLNWLYWRNLNIPSKEAWEQFACFEQIISGKQGEEVIKPEMNVRGCQNASAQVTQDMLVRLFAFAERRMVPGLRNEIMTILVKQRELG